jgi:methyl-accepting chemotaxis protein
MATQQEVTQELNDVKAQIRKGIEEQSKRSDALLQKITDLEAIIAQGGTIGQELVDALNGVKAEAQALDDLIPDAPPA